MTKNSKNLVFLTIVLLLLLAGLYMLLNRPEASEEKQVLDERISLVDFSYGDIKSISFVLTDSKDFSLEKSNKGWSCKDSSIDYSLDQSAINKSVRKLIELEALNRLEDETPEDLSPYGLANPSIITTNLGDNGIRRIYIGNRTIRESFYLMVDDDPCIYEVDLETGLAITTALNTYRLKDIIQTIDMMTLEQLIILRENKENIEIVAIEDLNNVLTTASHRLIQPFPQAKDMNNDFSEVLLAPLNALRVASDIVEDDSKDLLKYGLDKPIMEIYIKDNKQDMNLMIGNFVNDTEELVYCMLRGDESVYTVNGEAIKYINSIEAYDLIFHFLMLVNIDSVDQILINKDLEEYVLTIDRESVNGKNKIYGINGKSVSEKSFIELYQKLIALSSDTVADEISNSDDVRISIEYINKADKNLGGLIELVTYNEFFYGAYVNGDYSFVVAKESLDEIFGELDELLLD